MAQALVPQMLMWTLALAPFFDEILPVNEYRYPEYLIRALNYEYMQRRTNDRETYTPAAETRAAQSPSVRNTGYYPSIYTLVRAGVNQPRRNALLKRHTGGIILRQGPCPNVYS